MKTHHSIIQGCCLVAALLLSSSMGWAGTLNRSAFKARRQTNLVRQVNSSVLTHSDTLSLRGMGTVYALSIDATIQQPREASFVRIVLEDTKGHDYLVAESDRFRNDTSTVHLSEYCEETAQLAGVTPFLLKCYMAGDATLQITGIHASNQVPTRMQATNRESDANIKRAQVQSIVNRINEYNIKHKKLWQAGVTDFSLRNIEGQNTTEEDAYTANMKFYIDGIYEIGERTENVKTSSSNFVSSFDWRDRHGKNWITPIKNQEVNGNCALFAAVGVAEALYNLYYNDTINLALSEQFIRECLMWDINAQYLSYQAPLEFIVTDSVIDEQSLPYSYDGLLGLGYRPVGQESVNLDSIITISFNGLCLDTFCDSVKYHLINHGPGMWGANFPSSSPLGNHYMTLIGYGTINESENYINIDKYGYNSYHGYADPSMIGKTYWIFKNSFGSSSSNPYLQPVIKIVFNNGAYIYNAYFANTPVTSRSNIRIKCEDRDGDGYYNWGINKNPPSSLPSWAHREKDANDSDRFIGPMDDKGNPVSVYLDSYENISNYTVVNKDSINYKHIVIKNGGTLVIKKHFHCFPGVWIYVESGGTLTIDSGILENVLIEVSENATINIKNEGQIILLPQNYYNLISIPETAKLNLLQGGIKKSTIIWEF